MKTLKNSYWSRRCLYNRLLTRFEYLYFKRKYNLIAIDLTKQQVLIVDPREIHQIYFTRNLEQARNTIIPFALEKFKKIYMVFRKER